VKALLLVFIIVAHQALAQPSETRPGTSQSDWFLAPRDKVALFLIGIETPFRNFNQFEKKKEKCLAGHLLPFQLCQTIEKIQIVPKIYEISLDSFLDEETSLLFIGERHSDQYPKELLTQWLRELQETYGFDTLGLEMINSKDQNILDSYLEGIVTEDDFKKLFEEEWHYPSEGYLALIREAKRIGLSIVALDAREKGSIRDMSESLSKRDRHWGKVITKHFKNQNKSKMVVLSGKLHALESFKTESLETEIEITKRESNIKAQSALIFEDRASFLQKAIIEHYYPDQTQYLYKGADLSPFASALIYRR